MSETIIATLITAAATILVVIFQNRATQNKVTSELEKRQAVTDTKMDVLTREVREHNNFARRMPVVEEQIKAVNHRLADLERKVET
jgi:hypothetical protein